MIHSEVLADLVVSLVEWVEEVDDRQIVISPPRAFQVPYKVEIATEVASAQQQIEGGGKAAVHRSAAHSGAQTLDVRPRRCYSGMRPAK